jgi:hypothetical protein
MQSFAVWHHSGAGITRCTHHPMQSKVAATTPAVSVRSRFPPKVTGTNPSFKADLTSSGEKSPSGPMRIKEVVASTAI